MKNVIEELEDDVENTAQKNRRKRQMEWGPG